MIQFIIYIILLLTSYSLSAQNEYNNWYFGRFAGISFNTHDKEPVDLSDSKISTAEGCASISDSTGKLLFYTDGVTVYNRKHEIMKNGEGLKGHYSSTQSALIIQKPGDPRFFYIFTVPWSYENPDDGLNYSIVDFSNSSDGELTMKNQFLYSETSEKLAGIVHSNKTDYWIISRIDNSNVYVSFLLNEMGLNTDPIISTTGYHIVSKRGHLKISPNNLIIASIEERFKEEREKSKIQFFSFDNSNGKFLENFYPSNAISNSAYGGEFSPDSKKFYLLDHDGNSPTVLIQYDLSNLNNITFSEKSITSFKNRRSAMQLAPDGKIYFNLYSSRYELSRIGKPNESLENCNLEYHTTYVYGKVASGLPNCIASLLLPGIEYSGSDTLCLGDTIRISTKLADYYLNPTIKWTGPEGFISEETEIVIPNAEEKHSGYYVATVFSENRPQYKDSIYIHVSLDALAPPEITADGSLEFCQGDSLLLSIDNYHLIKWTTGETERSIYVKEAGVYGVTVENESGCYSYSEVEVFVSDSLQPTIQGETSICEGDSVVLSTEVQYQYYMWSTGETSESIVIYDSGIYTVKVSNEEGCSGTSDEFSVTMNPLPEPNIKGNITVCFGAEETYSVGMSSDNKINWYMFDGGEIISKDDESNVVIDWTELGTWELYVEVTNEFGCIGYETIEVTVEQTDKPEIVMSSPKLCPGSTITLSVDKDYDSYAWYSSNWTDSKTGKQIEIDEIGSYILEVTSNGCIGLDTVLVEEADPIEVSIIGEDKICSGNPITLSADDDYANYEWSTSEETKEISITQPGIYSLKVTNDDGCEGTTDIEVTEIEIDLRFVDTNPKDFGEVELGNQQNITVSIQNFSEYELKYLARIDNQSLIQISQSDNSIEIGKSQDIDLTFTPDYPQYYLDKLIIEVTEPCDYVIEKEITGAGYINTKVWIEDSTVYPDTKNYCVPIQTQITTDYAISLDIDYTAQIMTDASLIIPDISHTTSGSDLVFDIQGSHNLSNSQNSINDICGWIIFADQKTTPIVINSFEWTDNEYIRVESEDGNIDMEHLCFDNLLHIESYQSTQMNISPNPASDEISINISSQEKGDFTLKIITIEGIEINNQSWEQSTDRLENKDINLDLSNISSGAYIIMLQSPFGVISKQLNVVR